MGSMRARSAGEAVECLRSRSLKPGARCLFLRLASHAIQPCGPGFVDGSMDLHQHLTFLIVVKPLPRSRCNALRDMPIELLAFNLGEVLLLSVCELCFLAAAPGDLLGRLRRRYAEARQFIDNRIMLGSAPLERVRATEVRSWTLNGVAGNIRARWFSFPLRHWSLLGHSCEHSYVWTDRSDRGNNAAEATSRTLGA
jgi:hypothetical protein